MTVVECPRSDIERRLGVGHQQQELLARVDLLDPDLGHREGHRAVLTSRIDGRHDQSVARVTKLLLLSAAGLVPLGGCGGTAGDLIAIEVSGGFEPRAVEVTVTGDGRARCGRGPLEPLPGELLLDARELERQLSPLAEDARSFGEAGGDRRAYNARMGAGAVRWVEGGPDLPPALGEAVVLQRALEREICG